METLPEVAPPVLKPVPVHEVALVELHEIVADSPTSIEEGLTLMLRVGRKTLQAGGLIAPLLQIGSSPSFTVTVKELLVTVSPVELLKAWIK